MAVYLKEIIAYGWVFWQEEKKKKSTQHNYPKEKLEILAEQRHSD